MLRPSDDIRHLSEADSNDVLCAYVFEHRSDCQSINHNFSFYYKYTLDTNSIAPNLCL
jgi:hypothetical protein